MLRQMNIEENRLKTLPPEIGYLTNLLELKMGYNEMETFPDEIGNISALKQLHLEHNKLVSLPKGVKYLGALELLVLTDNLLEDLPNEMVHMTSLAELKVDGNPFGAFPTAIRDAGGRDTYNYIIKREAKGTNKVRKKKYFKTNFYLSSAKEKCPKEERKEEVRVVDNKRSVERSNI